MQNEQNKNIFQILFDLRPLLFQKAVIHSLNINTEKTEEILKDFGIEKPEYPIFLLLRAPKENSRN